MSVNATASTDNVAATVDRTNSLDLSSGLTQQGGYDTLVANSDTDVVNISRMRTGLFKMTLDGNVRTAINLTSYMQTVGGAHYYNAIAQFNDILSLSANAINRIRA
jgi:hypothetical protein